MIDIIDMQSIGFRPVTKADNRFLRDLYCTSRDYETAALDWPEKKLTVFFRQQFALQQKHFGKTYPKADKQLVIHDGQAIGRFYTHFDKSNRLFHLVDVTLVRQFRGRGIGRFLIAQLIDKAARQQARVSLYVQSFNPAFKLYQAMGFKQISARDGYLYMEYQP